MTDYSWPTRRTAGVASAARRVLFLALGIVLSPALAQTPPRPCEEPIARWLDCGNGVRISAYEPSPDLGAYCQMLADPEKNLKRSQPGSPVFELPAGYRTLYTGTSGWLILPRDKDPTDLPSVIRHWWLDLGCVRS